MGEPVIFSLSDVLQIPLSAVLSEAFPKPDEDQKSTNHHQSSECCNQERILVAHIGHPGRNPGIRGWSAVRMPFQIVYKGQQDLSKTRFFLPVSNGETHGIPHDNNRHNSIGPKVAVRINTVGYRQLASHGDAGAEHVHGNNKTEPMDIVCRPNTPKDQTAGHNEKWNGIKPETVLLMALEFDVLQRRVSTHLGLADAAVTSGFPQNELVAQGTRVIGSEYHAQVCQCIEIQSNELIYQDMDGCHAILHEYLPRAEDSAAPPRSSALSIWCARTTYPVADPSRVAI